MHNVRSAVRRERSSVFSEADSVNDAFDDAPAEQRTASIVCDHDKRSGVCHVRHTAGIAFYLGKPHFIHVSSFAVSSSGMVTPESAGGIEQFKIIARTSPCQSAIGS